MTIALLTLTLIVSSLLLAFSTDIILGNVKKISRLLKINKYALAGFFIALGTSLPELIISVKAATIGESTLALGNIIGSNIANLSVIIGGATLIAGSLKISKTILESDIYYAFLLAMVPFLLLLDGKLGRWEGLVLIVLFSLWQIYALRNGKTKQRGKIFALKKHRPRFLKRISSLSNRKIKSLPLKLVLGFAGLIVGAEKIVFASKSLADIFNIPLLLIGIFIIGLGSSLPELTLEIKAIKRKEAAIALGDLLGSIIANSTLILGLASFIHPITVFYKNIYLTSVFFFFLLFGLFYLFIKTKARIERWEGAILLTIYLILALVELL